TPLLLLPFLLSLHDALPISPPGSPAGTCNLSGVKIFGAGFVSGLQVRLDGVDIATQGGTLDNIAASGNIVEGTALCGDVHAVKRSEEHTSELQSRFDLVCRL